MSDWKRRVIELLKSGTVSEAVMDEVVECLLVAAEDYGLPFLEEALGEDGPTLPEAAP
jgi:hypothetical protein